jgi:NTP pyrophosphatase (non-canonical NTP hydrolase)
MNNEQYVEKSARTDLPSYAVVAHRLQNEDTCKLLHAGIGLSTEANEVLDMLKKHIYYGKPIDKVNLAEECGDILWYVSIVCRVSGLSIEQLMEMNINKLAKRFPEKFTEELADNRDLAVERTTLESSYAG